MAVRDNVNVNKSTSYNFSASYSSKNNKENFLLPKKGDIILVAYNGAASWKLTISDFNDEVISQAECSSSSIGTVFATGLQPGTYKLSCTGTGTGKMMAILKY